MKILGIETSCDETGVAIYSTESGLLANLLHSQVALHAPFGGVVPELASRDHTRHLPNLIRQACQVAQLSLSALDGVAYTAGPGLMGALLVGACTGQALAVALNKPAIPLHHLEAHLMAAGLESSALKFPFLVLLVSGGHTQLLWVPSPFRYELLGETLDDAVGEAFDKVAKFMGLGYPGGPALEQLARLGRPGCFTCPRPLQKSKDFNFSFAGLKTHVVQLIKSLPQVHTEQLADIAYAFQEAVIDVLMTKSLAAIKKYGAQQFVMAGGVSANQALRDAIKQAFPPSIQVIFPRPLFCTDNGAMVAYLGALKLQKGLSVASKICVVKPRWPLSDLSF